MRLRRSSISMYTSEYSFWYSSAVAFAIDVIALLHPQRRARQPRGAAGAGAQRREHPEGHVFAGIDFLLDLDHFEMKVDFVRISVAIKIAPDSDRVLGCAGNRRQLRFERVALGRAAAAIGLDQPKAVEIGDDLVVAWLVRSNFLAGNAQHGKRRQ